MTTHRLFIALALGVVTLTTAQCGGGSSTPTSPSVTPAPSPAPTSSPAPAPSPTPSPAPVPAPSTGTGSLSISPQTVQGQSQPQATVTLTAAAPAGGATVQLGSNNERVARVPATVTVAAGARTATFHVDTSTVSAAESVVITAVYGSESLSATLTVTVASGNAAFVVRSAARGVGACEIEAEASEFDCVLDGSSSTGSLSSWIWTYTMGTNTLGHTSRDAGSHPDISTKCGFLQTATGGDGPNGEKYLNMTVTLQVQTGDAVRSNIVQQAVKVYPNHQCGFSY